MKHAVRWDDFKEGAQVCNTSQSCHELDLSHTQRVRVKSAIKCGTPTRQKYVRVTRGSVFCERVVLGNSAKVLINWSAQGICPPHRGRWC